MIRAASTADIPRLVQLEAVVAIYVRAGYRPAERNFMKEL